MLGGAIPPLVAGPIIAAWGGFTFGIILACVAVVSLICVRVIGETKDLELDREDTRATAEVQ
jgi:asparagine N-glycosylation enzyme membrane subunit Stt3